MPPSGTDPPRRADAAPSSETLELLTRLRNGDERAGDQLIARYIPELTRWAAGRLPRWARHAVETDDLVQETLIRVFQKMGSFEYRGEGALLAYLRQAVLNRIRNQVRWADRRPKTTALDDQIDAEGPSPLEAAVGAEALEWYETALEGLRPEEREAIIARIELGLTYPELARALGKPSPDAARMTVARALVRLSEEIRRVRRASNPQPGRDDR